MSTSSTSDKSRQNLQALHLALWDQPDAGLPAETLNALLPSERDDQHGADQSIYHLACNDGSTLPDLGPLSSFDSWLSVASTIYYRTEQLTDYDPGSPAFNAQAWGNFAARFASFPLFLSFTRDTRAVSFGQIDFLIGAIIDMSQVFGGGDVQNGAMEGIKKIFQFATEHKLQAGSSQAYPTKTTYCQMGVLSVTESQLRMGYIRFSLSMDFVQGKGYQPTPGQTVSVFRAMGILDFGATKRHGDTISNWNKQSVDAWRSDASANNSSLNPR